MVRGMIYGLLAVILPISLIAHPHPAASQMVRS
ncbi:transmembrane protein [Rhizobium sp. Pop5]|nr:transmembrane protein [Rhizobium sp. Pop5]